MPGLPYVREFRELVVYQKQRRLAFDLFRATAEFPREERYSLIDQMRRASRSIGAQIAEAWAKHRYEPHFISKLTDADGEQKETQHWILTACDCAYFSKVIATEFLTRCTEIGRLLNRMIATSSSFCQEPDNYTLQEDSGEFYAPIPADDPDIGH